MPRHLPFRIIALGLLISACVDQPTAPENSAPVPFGRPAASASPSFSASHTIPVPGSTLLEFGTIRLAPTGIVIPRDMWVRVRVSGSVRIDADPEWVRRFCNPGPPSECPPPYDGASAGPLGVADGLEVQVAMNNAWFLWRPRAAGGDGAEDIMYVSAGTKVLAGRAGLWEFGDCWGCTHEPGRAGRYRLSGSQALTVEEINPLSVRADRTEVDPADPVSFTARADEEMRNLQWAFVAGDTLPESGPSAARVPAGGASFSMAAASNALTADWNALASCRGKEACTTPVAVSGRMWVRGHIEDQIVFAKSQVVRVQPVRLKLDCTPNPVTRGQSISCTASAQPEDAQITGVRWNFVDMTGHNTAGPAGDDALRWGGTMVIGGMMKVAATVNGMPKEETLTIVVTPRAWQPFRVRPDNQGHGGESSAEYKQDDRPQSADQLGHAHFPVPPSPLDVGRISEGPNTGYSYLRSFPPELRSVIHISRAWDAGHPFREMQHDGPVLDAAGNPVLDSNGNPVRYCRKSQLSAMKAMALRHEEEHVRQIDQFFRANSPHHHLEAAVYHASELLGGTFESRVQGEFLRRPNAALAQGDQRYEHVPLGKVSLAVFPCQLRYYP